MKILENNKIKVSKKHTIVTLLVVSFFLAVISIFTYWNMSMNVKESQNHFTDLGLGQFSDKKIETPPSETPAVSDGQPSQTNTTKPPRPNACILILTLAAKQKSTTNNGAINYAMSLTNDGAVACNNSTISIYYANNETFVSSTPSATASNYYWNAGTLAAGSRKDFLITTTVDNSQATVNTQACATADNSEDVCASSLVAIGDTMVMNTQVPSNPGNTTENSANGSSVILPALAPLTENIKGKEYGVWVWVSPLDMTQTYIETIVNAATSYHINTLYVTFDDYLNIYYLPEGQERTAKINRYSNAVLQLVKIAKQKNIVVDAEMGARDWGEQENHQKPLAIIDYVIGYNKTYPLYQVRGIQYDVESYLIPAYQNSKNKEAILTNFISLIDKTERHLESNNLRFSVVIPHFYDNTIKWTPPITYQGKSNYVFNILLEILDRKTQSTLVIMAYRNFTDGDDSSVDISNIEINEASSNQHKTKIIIAQETGNVEPGYVTFYGTSKEEYFEQANTIVNTFKKYAGFGGIAVHYIDSFLELK